MRPAGPNSQKHAAETDITFQPHFQCLKMDTHRIIRILHSLLDDNIEDYARLKASGASRLSLSMFLTPLAGRLENCISQQPEFQTPRMVSSGTSTSLCNPFSSASTLTSLVFDGMPPVEAVAGLEFFLSSTSASGSRVMCLWGIAIDESVNLGDGIWLRPYSDLRPSPIKAIVDEHFADGLSRLVPNAWSTSPPCVLEYECVIEPLFFPPGQPGILDAEMTDYYRLRRLALLLTAVGPCAPIEVLNWFYFHDDRVQSNAIGGGYHFPNVEIVPTPFSSPTNISGQPIQEVIANLLAICERDRRRMENSLARLNQSMRRHSAGDRALDLAIALESLLAGDKGENVYKVSMHAGAILPGTLDERLAARNLVKALYDIRSRVVHDGSSPQEVSVPGRGKVSALDVVRESTQLTGRIVKAIATRGDIPDWNRLIYTAMAKDAVG
jgi:hypothetical protein